MSFRTTCRSASGNACFASEITSSPRMPRFTNTLAMSASACDLPVASSYLAARRRGTRRRTAVNIYVSDMRMTDDIDVLSTNAGLVVEEIRASLAE